MPRRLTAWKPEVVSVTRWPTRRETVHAKKRIPTRRTAVVTLSHEERLDIPAVAAALEKRARYIGAVGAKRTAERRRARLAEQGFSDADIARIHGPAGLDLGGRAPAEVALAIAAEIVAETSGGVKKKAAAAAAS